VTEVQFSGQQGGAPGDQALPRILTVYLSLEGEEYRVLDYQEGVSAKG